MPRGPRLAVIGGGPMGLAVAYELCLQGCPPVLLEADDRLGGMAASFDFAGVSLERYYHFHCLGDRAFLQLLEELDLAGAMRWRQTRMGFFCDGRMYPWGSTGSVLGFPRLPLLTRIRYLLHAARCLSLRHWHHLDRIPATRWLRDWLGEEGYQLLWARLFAFKFHHHSDDISAAWIWSRIRRVGKSRHWLKETLGHLDGGSQRWIDALARQIRQRGGDIRLGSPVRQVGTVHEAGRTVVELKTPAGAEHFDAVICTVPLPLVAPMLRAGGVDPALIEPYETQRSLACACVVIQTRIAVTQNFWTNINDARFGIPGIIEMTNLQPLTRHITYIPFYIPADHPDYARPDQAFIDDSLACLMAINPDLKPEDVLAGHCSRYRFAQPVCGTGFPGTLPPLCPLPQVWIADTTVYYPEDRGISESIGFGRNLARRVVRAWP